MFIYMLGISIFKFKTTYKIFQNIRVNTFSYDQLLTLTHSVKYSSCFAKANSLEK